MKSLLDEKGRERGKYDIRRNPASGYSKSRPPALVPIRALTVRQGYLTRIILMLILILILVLLNFDVSLSEQLGQPARAPH